jgi:hypothetical protein
MQRGMDMALKRRSGSASAARTKRSRRRMLGLTAAVAVHGLAALAVLPVARSSVPNRSQPDDADAPVTVVELVHLRPLAQSAPAAAAQPQDSPRSKPASLPETPAPFDVAQADPEAPGPAPPSRPEDDDPLYRVPFRDAVAQADARLRAGLGCAHVDMDQLPQSVLDLCAAAAGVRGPRRPRGPLS